MMDESFVKAIGDLAVSAEQANRVATHTPAILVGGKLVSLEPFEKHRSRFRGTLGTPSLADFVGYVARRIGDTPAGAAGFVDPDSMCARVIFNLGDGTDPGHCDDVADLSLVPSAEYLAVQSVSEKRLDQRSIAEFMEDWSPYLVTAAETGEIIPITAAINAVRALKITTKTAANTQVGNFTARRSAMEEVEASASLADLLPHVLVFTFTPFAGFPQSRMRFRLSVLRGGDEPVLVLRPVQYEMFKEQVAQEFKLILIGELGEKLPLTIGTFTP